MIQKYRYGDPIAFMQIRLALGKIEASVKFNEVLRFIYLNSNYYVQPIHFLTDKCVMIVRYTKVKCQWIIFVTTRPQAE